MRFGVLGPLAVWAEDGRPVRVPELKVRALLADLLVHEGRPVSSDRLVDDLWSGDRLPRNPMGALQTRVSQLRRALEEAETGGRDLVVSQAPGYLLRTRSLDAARFQALTVQARGTGEPRARVKFLDEALALWRGSAYADFADEEFARPAITRLEEERLAAVEEWAEARLALGEHSPLVADLGDLVARNPSRERLQAAHLRALYRSGRQSEALAAFAELRERLADDLGLDPGPELTALHGAILAQDPALITPAPVASVAPVASAASSCPAGPPALPAPVTDLVGRAGAVAEIQASLTTARLVTLTGPGGVGKTRLAVETAREAGSAFPDGVWPVELEALDRASPARVVDVVAEVLGVRDDAPGPGDPRRADQVAGALRASRALLLLDNCEHVVEQVAELVAPLLRAAPDLRVLATSQEPLGIDGEHLHVVAPLESADAVRLFEARVAAAVPGYTVGPGDAEAVASVCRRLDGIPLALELAATRVRALGVHELAERLDDRFRVLVSGRRDAPARQRTLRAMIDWSWELLPEPERLVLRRLSVHAGGCTLQAAEDVCGDGGLDVPDVLARLVDRSLVVAGDGPRYRLLDSVRAYGAERLREAGEADAIRRRHLRHHVELAVRAEPHLYGHDQRRWLQRLDEEAANLRAALDAAITLGATGDALRLVNALAWYWFLRGRLTEARRSLGLAVTAAAADGPGENGSARTRALVWRAGFAVLSCDGTDPAARADAARTARLDMPDPGMRAWAQWFVGFAHRGFGDLEVTAGLVERALASFRTVQDRWGTAAALSVRATIGRARGDLAAAARDAAESHALFGELGDRWGGLKAANTLAELAEISGDYARAGRLHRDGLRMAEELRLWAEASFTLSGLGRIALLNGDLAVADDLHGRAMRLAAGQSNTVAEHFAEVGLALAARRRGDLGAAEAHLGKWLGWIRKVDGEPGLALVLAELGFCAELRGDAEAARSLHLDGLAAARGVGDPRAVALALEGLAGARTVAGDPGDAARLLGAAGAVRESVGAPLPPAERGDVDRITAAARAALGAGRFAAEFAAGAKSDPDAAGNTP